MAATLCGVINRPMSPFCAPSMPAPRAWSGRNVLRRPAGEVSTRTVTLAGAADAGAPMAATISATSAAEKG
jgi:hypothetical protein